MEQEVTLAFTNAAKSFRDGVALFTLETLNKIPFEGSWTGGQVADHILKSIAGLPQVIAGKTTTTDREPDEKKEAIGNIFLNMEIKMKSPDFILPTNDPLDKEALLERIDTTTRNIINAMEANDLSRTCLDFEVPGLGAFTGIEWGWFATDHTIRHTMQLGRIYKGV